MPFSSSIYLCAEAILRFGTDEQKELWLPRLASGEIIGTLAITESVEEVRLILFGQPLTLADLLDKNSSCHGLIADIAIVLARQKDQLILVLVEQGLIETVDPTMASAKITFNNQPAQLMTNKDGWNAHFDINRAAVLYTFEQIGGAEQALNMAVSYAKEHLHSAAIGSFQALKHMIAIYVRRA